MFYLPCLGLLSRGALPRRLAALAINILFFYLLTSSVTAQLIVTDQRLTLSDAIARTLANNPQLHQYRLQEQALLGKRLLNDLSPALRLGVEVENVAGGGEYSGHAMAETTLSLSSVIELGSKRSSRRSAATARLDLLDYRRQAFTLDVLGDLTAIFVKTLKVQALSSLALETRDLTQDMLVIVQDRSQRGAAPDSELRRAIAAKAMAQLRVDDLQQQLQRNRTRLAGFWGETSTSWQLLAGDLYAFSPQLDFSELYRRALSSPAIEVFASERRLKTAELQLAQTQSRPDIGWQLGIRRLEESSDSALSASISLPLFSGKRNRGAVSAALARRDEIEFERRTAELRLYVQLFDAYSRRQQFIHSSKVFQSTIIPELSSALASTQQAYETGRYSYQDWIAAQKELLNAKQTAIESAAAASLSQAVIEQLIAQSLQQTES